MEKLYDVPLKLDKMYLRGTNEKSTEGVRGTLLTTDTYFGCFHCEAYAENSTVENVAACIRIKGTGTAELRWLVLGKDETVKKENFNTDLYELLSLQARIPNEGVLYLKLTGNFDISEIWYEGDGETRETKISVIICTYKREAYVKKNLEILSDYINDNLAVICVDNGGTLVNVPEGIVLVKNRNYGGSGGYARGMMESQGRCTHFWMMDDDIQFEPTIVQKAITFIKHRKREDVSLAAGMFSFEEPTVQQEATAVFDGYTFHSNVGGIDFNDRSALLKNRIEQRKNTYGGWWSLIMPSTDRLPMPFFIKLDDVEYGLRQARYYVVMDGFGVWHEAFGKKGNAWSEYYTTRNTLIIQSMYSDMPHSTVRMMSIRLLKALAYGEPKCMEAVLRGVEDYVAGPEKFSYIDPETKHKEIMEVYRASLVSDMNRKKMLKAALINVLRPRNWKSISLFIKAVNLLKSDKRDDRWKDMMTVEFWREYLGV